ncbi:TolC family outer membrane protein [Aquincola sp. S2]|uniref:TolC family outer membrane protein n=1 Tax=Pseudaquabacterium terrae TaxID=2732868 RepID=A0ABX2EDW4_9BURK|nr:TolC family outer membrane protein [Aquabacterium terrae]NRF66809.1 TolC family outer membrane protein [Aquabacterium terrae]
MRRAIRRLRFTAIAAALLAAGSAQAMNFAEAVAAARSNDPAYRGAGHELESTRQGVPIARAALLPQVGLAGSYADVHGTRSFFNAQDQEAKVGVAYNAPHASLQMRLPLFNAEARARLDQAEVQVDQAEANYRGRGLDLIDRVGTAYLRTLLAAETLGLAEQERVSAEGQLKRSAERFRRGEGTRSEEALAQSNLDVNRVKVFEAKDQLENARRALQRLTGRATTDLNQMNPEFVPDEPAQGGLFEWLETAVRNSPTIRARQQALLAAQFNVKRQSAGHLPRVDLVASIARSENESLTNLGQTSVLKTLSLQVNVPIYSGGGVSAGVKQAVAEQAKAEEAIREERENVETEVQRNYLLVANGAARVQAYRRAAESSQVAYTGAVRSQEAGLGTTADVLDAQVRLFAARRDLAAARYDYLSARLRLKAHAGLPLDEVTNDIDRLLPLPLTTALKQP